jgi:hypothetical protein
LNLEESIIPVGYDWEKGMKVNNEFNTPLTIDISVGGETTRLFNIKFYDTVNGFIQTETHFYLPKELA